MGITSCNISNINYPVRGSDDQGFQFDDVLEVPGALLVIVQDASGTANFERGDPIELVDSVDGVIYRGSVLSSKPLKASPDINNTYTEHTVTCIDRTYPLTILPNTTNYENWYAGDIAVDMVVNGGLKDESVTVAAGLHRDSTDDDFNTGINSNVVGTLTVGDGDLELAPSGSAVTYSEATTADFATGTLKNVTATNNTLVPTSANAIKMVAVQSLAGTNSSSAVSSVMIWSGSQAIAGSGQVWIEYDMFVDPASPAAQMSLDFLLSNGTDFSAVATINGANEDGQFILPDASNDLSGLATTGWYHRKFSITTYDAGLAQWTGANGKTISSIMLVCKGAQPGTYIGYFKNIQITGATTATLLQNTTQQLQSYGFSSTNVMVVPTYDLYSSTADDEYGASAYKVTSTISISAVGLYRTSFISWAAIVPDKCSLVVKYSLDGTAFIACTNGAELPYLPAGLDVSGKSIQLQYEFYFLPGALPDSQIILEQVDLTISPTAAATKTDATYSVLTQANWNAGTKTNTVANASGELTLNGLLRTWDDSSTANQTMYPSGIQQQTANNRSFTLWNIPSGSNVEVRSRFDFAGQWQDFTAEVDVQLSPNDPVQHGMVYRTTNWQTHSGSAAYYVWLTPVFIALGKGTNSTGSAATAQTIITSKSIVLASDSWHRLKVVVSGNSHQVYLDGILMLSATDSTYTASGYMGVYTTDGGSGATDLYTTFFDNFGVVSALSGTWLSPSTSLSSVGSYGNSIITWRDKSPSYNGLTNTSILVEVTYNGGTTYFTCTNGQPLPGLTLGQSLSGVSMQFRITLASTSASSLAAIDNLIVRVMGQYSSSGTRSTKPMGIDYIDRADQAGLGTASDGQAWSPVGTATAAVTSNKLVISNTTGDFFEQLGSRTDDDMDMTVPFMLSASTMTGGMTLRYVDSNNYYKLQASTASIDIVKKVAGVSYTLVSVASTLTINTQYYMRFRVVDQLPVLLYGRIWLAGTLEDQINWTISTSD
jgi:hypothetical protein